MAEVRPGRARTTSRVHKPSPKTAPISTVAPERRHAAVQTLDEQHAQADADEELRQRDRHETHRFDARLNQRQRDLAERLEQNGQNRQTQQSWC